jgi:AcrR family transcriptional regulator
VTAAARPTWPGPWAAAEPQPSRRRTLSREAVVEAALGIVDAEGLDALSMRRVSQELNTGPASLYAHVGSKEQLVELLLDRVHADLVHPVPDAEHWREQTRDFLRQARDNLVAHNDIARAALVSTTPLPPHRLAAAETLTTLLRTGGMPDRVVAHGVDLLGLHLVASAYEESQRLTTRSAGDQRWEFGVDVVLAGLEGAARAETAARAEPARTAGEPQAERRSSEAR